MRWRRRGRRRQVGGRRRGSQTRRGRRQGQANGTGRPGRSWCWVCSCRVAGHGRAIIFVMIPMVPTELVMTIRVSDKKRSRIGIVVTCLLGFAFGLGGASLCVRDTDFQISDLLITCLYRLLFLLAGEGELVSVIA